ncbi:MAG: oligosaccharide flippase family protein [Bacteroidales bacterium]|nr:oligosaccharide flippase family protein [Bacteroidales bacterium]
MKKIFKYDLFKNTLVLASGTITAQLIPLVMQPVLKRIYTPEDFGVFEVYYRILSILAAIITLKYELGIVQQKNKKHAETLFILTVINGFIITIILSILYSLFSDKILYILKIPGKFYYIFYILFLSAFFFALSTSSNYLLLRKEKFKIITISKIIRRIAEGIVQSFSLIKHIPYLLFIGDLIGNISYVINSIKNYHFKKEEIKNILNLKRITLSYRNNFHLAKYNVLPNLLNAFVLSSLTFLTLSNFAINTVGYLELALKILLIPSSMVSVAVGQGLLQKVSANKNRNKSVKHDLLIVITGLTVIAIIFTLLIVLFAEPVFKILFGNEWIQSAYYAKTLVVYISVAFIFSPMGQVLIAFEKFKTNAVWQIIRFIFILSLFFIKYTNITNLLIIFSITNIVFYFIYGFIIFYQVKKYEKKIAINNNIFNN